MSGWQAAAIRGSVVAAGLMAFGMIAYDFIKWEQIGLAIGAGIIVALGHKDDQDRR
jgi:hypothetical protein